MTQHTPGQWKARKIAGRWSIASSDHGKVAELSVLNENHEADARLIAAAPDLLDALRGAMFFVPVGTLARERADAAIALATEEVQT